MRIPKYRRHKASGQAIVKIKGFVNYLYRPASHKTPAVARRYAKQATSKAVEVAARIG